jgi:hypothetical protein
MMPVSLTLLIALISPINFPDRASWLGGDGCHVTTRKREGGGRGRVKLAAGRSLRRDR